MKQISARQFRVAFPLLTEPVQVAQRREGELVVLGVWTPQPTAIFRGPPVTPAEVKRFGSVADLERAGFTPVPKPKPRRKS